MRQLNLRKVRGSLQSHSKGVGKQNLSSDLLLLGLVANHSYHPVATLPQLSPVWLMPLPQLNLDAVDYVMPSSVHEGRIGDHQAPYVPYKWSRMESPPWVSTALLRPWGLCSALKAAGQVLAEWDLPALCLTWIQRSQT